MQDTASPPDPLADDEARRLDLLLAWRCQTRDVDQAAAIGEALARRGADERSRGLGWFHLALARPRSSVPRVDEAALPAEAAALDRLPKPVLPERLAVWLAQVQQHACHPAGPAP